MGKRRLTKEEKIIKEVTSNFLYKRNMPKASNFLEELSNFQDLKRIEVVVYHLYFKYYLEVENQITGMPHLRTGTYSVTSKDATPLKKFAKSFNALQDDEKLAVLTQLFPKDFEVDTKEEAIVGIGIDKDDEEFDNEADIKGTFGFHVVVRQRTEYQYV